MTTDQLAAQDKADRERVNEAVVAEVERELVFAQAHHGRTENLQAQLDQLRGA